MKSRVALAILSLIIAVSFANAQPLDNTYVNSRYKCSIQGLENWRLDTSQKDVLVAFNNVDGVSSITLRAFVMNERPTANGVADMMAHSVYDGWMRAGGRKGAENDIFITGADDKYEAIYKKTILSENGEKITTIVGEAYYIKDSTAYVLTATTTASLFPGLKHDIRKIMKSFYIDEKL